MKIQEFLENAIDVAANGYAIYVAISKHMDAMEIKGGLSGAEKKRWVMDFIYNSIEEVRTNWTFWFNAMSKFIDSIKLLFNIGRA